MGIISRRGAHRLVNPNTALGAGSASLYNPLRSDLDYAGALGRIGEAAQEAGEGIKRTIDSTIDNVVEFIYETTGIDLSAEAALLEQLLAVPIDVLDGKAIGDAFGVLGTFLPFLPGADPATFNLNDAATSFITNVLNPTGLLVALVNGLLDPSWIPPLDATKIVTGQFALDMIQGLEDRLAEFPVLGDLAVALTGNPGALADIANWSNLVPLLAGGLLDPAVLPLIDATKIGSGVMDLARLPASLLTTSSQIAAAAISGLLDPANIPLLDATKIATGEFPLEMVAGLVDQLATFPATSDLAVALTGNPGALADIANWSNLVPLLVAGFLPGAVIPSLDATIIGSGKFLPTLIPNLDSTWGGLIDPSRVVGLLGAQDLGAAVQAVNNAGAEALGAVTTGVDASIAQFKNGLSALAATVGINLSGAAPAPTSIISITRETSDKLAQRAVQKPTGDNLDPSVDATFYLSDIWHLDPLPTIPVTQTKTAMGYIRIRDGGLKKAICWKGYGLTGIREFVVNLCAIGADGLATQVYTSGNVIGLVADGATPQYNYLNLDDADFQSTTQGDLYRVEIQTEGPGTYNLVGQTLSSQLGPHPTATPALPGAQRTELERPHLTNIGQGGGSNFHGAVRDPFTHAFGPDDDCLVIVAHMQESSTSLTFTAGGVAVPAKSTNQYWVYNPGFPTSPTAFQIQIYALMIPDSWRGTTKSIRAAAAGSTLNNWSAQSFSVAGVSSVGAGQAVAGSGYNQSQTVTAAENQLVLQAFGTDSTQAPYTTGWQPGQSLVWQYNNPVDATGYQWGLFAAAGADSVRFTNTLPAGGYYANAVTWGGVALPLIGVVPPAPATMTDPREADSPADYTQATPWLGMAGEAGHTSYPAVEVTFGAGAGQIFDPKRYAWANYFDVLSCPDGGGGAGGSSGGGFGGGRPEWHTDTLTPDQFTGDAWTINVGPGGPGGAPNANGGPGQGNSVVIPGYGTIAGAGGAAGVGALAQRGGVPGASMPGLSWTDARGEVHEYAGGAGGGSPQASGGSPGAGGAGGNSVYVGSYIYGGRGGAGVVIIRAYQ